MTVFLYGLSGLIRTPALVPDASLGGCLSSRVQSENQGQSEWWERAWERAGGRGTAVQSEALLLPDWKVRVQNQRCVGLRMGRVGPPSSSPDGNPSCSVPAGRLSKDGASHSAEMLPGGFRVSLPDQPAA